MGFERNRSLILSCIAFDLSILPETVAEASYSLMSFSKVSSTTPERLSGESALKFSTSDSLETGILEIHPNRKRPISPLAIALEHG